MDSVFLHMVNGVTKDWIISELGHAIENYQARKTPKNLDAVQQYSHMLIVKDSIDKHGLKNLASDMNLMDRYYNGFIKNKN